MRRSQSEERNLLHAQAQNPYKRHRFKGRKEKMWVPVNIAYLYAFFGVLCIMAATKVRSWRLLWMESEGLNVPVIQNMMPQHCFDEIRRFIHIVDNETLHPKRHPRWNPLQKIKPFMDSMLLRFRCGYVMGKFMSVDESMILYKGNQIKFLQYMPAKPIKHGIKVFALCCAETGYMYGSWVYCGRENDSSSPAEIVDRLMRQDPDFLTNSAGRILYSDNYYTGEELMTTMWNKYKMILVGTVSLSKKKSRTQDDFAFHKLSGPAKKKVEKGWLRWAQKKVLDSAGNLLYIIQNTTWMDRKQVGIMHNIHVGPAGDFNTFRYDRQKKQRVPVSTHPIVPNYIRYMRGVDVFDQSMNDYNISQKSNRWYLRIFYYYCNAALANMRIATRRIVNQHTEQREDDRRGSGVDGQPFTKDPWQKYLKPGGQGWFYWMLDLGHALFCKACELEGYDGSDESKRPAWMRQKQFVPCNCKRCFFCMNNLTGRYGPPRAPLLRTPQKRPRSTPTLSTPSRSSSSSKALPSLSRSGSSTMGRLRGNPIELEREHVLDPEYLFDGRNCGVCMEEGRTRKPAGVVKTEENKHLHINKCTSGCPHLDCRTHPVCKDHWPSYKHKKFNFM